MTGPGHWVGPPTAPNTYRLVRLLGGGGEGEVWHAILPLSENGRSQVAVKILCGTDEPDEQAQWERHGHLLQSLSHPGLVRVTSTFVGPAMHRPDELTDVQPGLNRYVIMDFLGGPTLRSWIEQNPDATLSTRLQMLRMVADALDEMHSGRRTKVAVAHGDVKPSNIIVGENDETVLVDLGLTRLADATGVSGQSRPYSAPELREPHMQATPDADRFAFIVTVAETLTGEPPPTGADGFLNLPALAELLRAHRLTRRRHALVGQVIDALEASAEQRPRKLRPWLDATAGVLSQVTDAPHAVIEKPANGVAHSATPDSGRMRPLRKTAMAGALVVAALFVAGGTLVITWPSSALPSPLARPSDNAKRPESAIIGDGAPTGPPLDQPSPSMTIGDPPAVGSVNPGQQAPAKAGQPGTPDINVQPRTSSPGRQITASPSSQTAASPVGPAPRTTATTDGVSCDPLTGAAVEVLAISAKDGQPGISTYNTIQANVVKLPPVQHTYWIIAHLFRSDGSPYVAKAQLRNSPGTESHDLQFNDVIGSIRDIFVVDADAAATASLTENNAHQFEGGWDNNREQLPPGAHVVSSTCHVRKTRD